jgi:hypothetical protein
VRVLLRANAATTWRVVSHGNFNHFAQASRIGEKAPILVPPPVDDSLPARHQHFSAALP